MIVMIYSLFIIKEIALVKKTKKTPNIWGFYSIKISMIRWVINHGKLEDMKNKYQWIQSTYALLEVENNLVL